MADPKPDLCGKCGAEIDPTRRIDYTLKDGTRVCDSCFVKGTNSPTRPACLRQPRSSATFDLSCDGRSVA